MKKKIVSIAITLILAIGLGNVVFAHNVSKSDWRFDTMLPQMKQLHPKMNDRV